jgi:hypothetical protein
MPAAKRRSTPSFLWKFPSLAHCGTCTPSACKDCPNRTVHPATGQLEEEPGARLRKGQFDLHHFFEPVYCGNSPLPWGVLKAQDGKRCGTQANVLSPLVAASPTLPRGTYQIGGIPMNTQPMCLTLALGCERRTLGKRSWWRTARAVLLLCTATVIASLLQAQTFTTLADFNSSIGSYPSGTLVQGSDGNFYAQPRMAGPIATARSSKSPRRVC